MSGKKKAVIIAIPVAVVLVLLIGVGSQPYVNTNAEEIAGVTQFHVLEDGSITKLRFSLLDNEGYAAASDAKVHLEIPGATQDFDVKASDFAQYKLQLTGQPVYAYAWQLNEGVAEGIASLTVTLPNGRTFTASDRVF